MFRTRKLSVLHASPHDFSVPTIKEQFLKDGTKISNVVYVPASSLGSDIPKPSEYKLSKLLAAGVPLHPVSSQIIDNAPSSAVVSTYLDKLEVSTPSVSPSDNNNEPSNND